MNVTDLAPTKVTRHNAHFPHGTTDSPHQSDPRALAGQVRAFVSDHLADHPAAPDVALVASELAANAVLHTRAGHDAGFDVTLIVTPGSRVRIEVDDPGADPASPPLDARPADEHGRGWLIVTALAQASGRERVAHGQRAWAEFGWQEDPTIPRSAT